MPQRWGKKPTCPFELWVENYSSIQLLPRSGKVEAMIGIRFRIRGKSKFGVLASIG
jgi:hypothetical protein